MVVIGKMASKVIKKPDEAEREDIREA